MAVDKWRERIHRARKHERKWRERAKKVIETYRDEQEREGSQFNILWANTETLRPALYSATPKPDIRRRYRDNEPVARIASTALERCASFLIDQEDYDGFAKSCLNDYLLPGRAVARVKYIPTFGKGEPPKISVIEEPILEATGVEVGVRYLNGEKEVEPEFDEDGPYILGEAEDELVYEEVIDEYVLWEDFAMDRARRWEDVTWVAFRSYMPKDELEESYPDADHGSIEYQTRDEDKEIDKTAQLWEIWDKRTRRVYVIADGLDDYLADDEDPLELEGFFPMPKPLYALESNGTLIPVPEYTLYQDQADELNRITYRITRLIEAIKARGAYPGSEGSKLEDLLASDELTLIPVDDWQGFAEKGGLNGMISWVPIEQFGKTLSFLFQKRSEILDTIYQITGLSDLQRGATDPRETAAAQGLKAQFGSSRLRPRQMDVAKFFRDLLRLKVEIIAERFQPDTIAMMSGLQELNEPQVLDQVMALIRDDARRMFSIDIETDSTLAADEAQDKQDVAELFTSISGLAAQIAPLMTTPNDKQIFKEMLLFATRRFKMGRNIEPLLENMGKQEEQEPQPNPEVLKAQAEIERDNQKVQGEMQLKQAEMEAEQKRKDAKVQQELELDRRAFEAEQRRKDMLANSRAVNGTS